MKEFRERATALFSWIALFCVLYFPFAAVLLHFIRTDLDPVSTVLSMYALGEAGTLLRVAFLLIGLSEIILSIRIYIRTGSVSNLGRLLLFIAGVGVCIVAIDKWGGVHNFGALLQFTSFPIAVLLIGFRQHKRAERHISISIGVVTSILLVLMIITEFGGPFHSKDISGLIQKTDICAIWIWLFLASLRDCRKLNLRQQVNLVCRQGACVSVFKQSEKK